MKREGRHSKQKILIDLTKRLRFSIFNCNVSISRFSKFPFIMTSTGMAYIFKCVGALVKLLGSCSKKSSTSPANKCLRDWFFKYFSHCPQWVSSRPVAASGWPRTRGWFTLIGTFVACSSPPPPSPPQNEFQGHRRHYKQIRISVMTAWIATRI